MTQTPAGWYQDHGDPATERWWDGTSWTDHTRPKGVPAPAPPPPPPPASVTPTVSAPPPSQPLPPPPSSLPVAAASPAAVPTGLLDRQGGGGLFGGKKALEDENQRLRDALAAIGVAERDQLAAEIQRLHAEQSALTTQVATLQAQVVATTDLAMLQEVGIYDFQHPLDDAVAYKAALEQLRDQIKTMARQNHAVEGAQNWTVNGSDKEGRRMVKDFCKLMLRAYNNEADNAVRSMKPYALASAKQRLEKAVETITKLGATMQIHVTPEYHRLRIRELELTADYIAKVAQEKEAEREQKARLREEEKARREFEREQARLEKERQHYLSALRQLEAGGGEPEAIANAQAKLAEIGDAIEGLAERAANVRAGYVYVISNVGSFGPNMVKIGMTRRLEPMDRVRELGDASVPFRFDVHALIFSEDAVGLETALHQRLAVRKVNLVNNQREFFYATPADVKALLAELQGDLLHYEDEPEALEWHQSENTRQSVPA